MSNNGGGGAVFKLTPAQKRKLALLSPNARPAYLHALKKVWMPSLTVERVECCVVARRNLLTVRT